MPLRLINRQPNKVARLALGLFPFLILIAVYMMASHQRLLENPSDKLLPAVSSFANSIDRMAFSENKRTGTYLFWDDTLASMQRIGIAVSISAFIGLLFGVATGAIPYIRAKLSPLITAISLIPPMAILPILFIVFGLGELAKVMLIVIGIAPFLIRDMQQRTLEVPDEQIIKAQTLGANSWHIILRVIVPQVVPRLIASVRLSLGSAWLFLIAAEAIASTEGLGYRIFLVRRYLAMDVILPYVAWITFLAFVFDFVLKKISYKLFPWFHGSLKES